MPQEISLKRGKQENNSLALFTDISQESPVIRNAVAQSMTSSSLLFYNPPFFFVFVDRPPLHSPKLLFPHLSSAACCHASQVEVACQQERGETTENDFTHDITALLCQVFPWNSSPLSPPFFFSFIRMSLPANDEINCSGMLPCFSPLLQRCY